MPRKILILSIALNIPSARGKIITDREGGNITEVFNANTFLYQPFASLPFQTQIYSLGSGWQAVICVLLLCTTHARGSSIEKSMPDRPAFCLWGVLLLSLTALQKKSSSPPGSYLEEGRSPCSTQCISIL